MTALKSASLRGRIDEALSGISRAVYGSMAEMAERIVAAIQAMYPMLGLCLPDRAWGS